jgi:hypothetical protein
MKWTLQNNKAWLHGDASGMAYSIAVRSNREHHTFPGTPLLIELCSFAMPPFQSRLGKNW